MSATPAAVLPPPPVDNNDSGDEEDDVEVEMDGLDAATEPEHQQVLEQQLVQQLQQLAQQLQQQRDQQGVTLCVLGFFALSALNVFFLVISLA
jgi:hypothetical protein